MHFIRTIVLKDLRKKPAFVYLLIGGNDLLYEETEKYVLGASDALTVFSTQAGSLDIIPFYIADQG